jgi:hypothetical protein
MLCLNVMPQIDHIKIIQNSIKTIVKLYQNNIKNFLFASLMTTNDSKITLD